MDKNRFLIGILGDSFPSPIPLPEDVLLQKFIPADLAPLQWQVLKPNSQEYIFYYGTSAPRETLAFLFYQLTQIWKGDLLQITRPEWAFLVVYAANFLAIPSYLYWPPDTPSTCPQIKWALAHASQLCESPAQLWGEAYRELYTDF